MFRNQTPYVSYLTPLGSSGGGGGGSGGGGDGGGNDNAFYKMTFFAETSVLELERISGQKISLDISSVNGHTVELDVNSTPISSAQAIEDWDSI